MDTRSFGSGNGGDKYDPYDNMARMTTRYGVSSYQYDTAPLMVYWEATRACDLACIHCRAEAVRHRHPLELTTEEGKQLLDQVAAFGTARLPHVVITGGNPLRRPDIVSLVRHGTERGLSVSTTPAGTPRFTADILMRLKEAGITSIALSLDGSTAARHDEFRQVRGSFDWTRVIARETVRRDIPLQINTMVTAETYDDLVRIYRLLHGDGISCWALFFLIPTGRGRGLRQISASQSEDLIRWITDLQLSGDAPFRIKTTEAPHFRRVYYDRCREQGANDVEIGASPAAYGFGVRDGNGVVFISHVGEVFPSGFLPLSVGDVRARSLAEIYRDAPLMRSLRDPEQLLGCCGRCPARAICGGSRARAFAATGDPLEGDPLCPFNEPSNEPPSPDERPPTNATNATDGPIKGR